MCIKITVAAGAQETTVVTNRSWDELIYMQDMNPEACASQPTPAAGVTNVPAKSLIDIRDGNTYSIAKLKDGGCWMTQNLRIIDKTIDSTYSDMTSGSFTIPAHGTGFTEGNQNTPKAYYDSRYGGYYNWYTATAGTGNTSITTDGTNAPSSICPKGWQLPINGSSSTNKTYSRLLSGLTTSVVTVAPYDFTAGGYVNNSSLNLAGSYGYYWSSTANSATNAYILFFNSSNVNPSNDYNRYGGNSVRCVAR